MWTRTRAEGLVLVKDNEQDKGNSMLNGQALGDVLRLSYWGTCNISYEDGIKKYHFDESVQRSNGDTP